MKIARLKRFKGFSIVELVFAIAIIATSLILFIGIFIAMFRATEKGVDLTAGTVVAESQLMRFLAQCEAKTVGFPEGLDKLDKTGSTVYEGTTQLNRTVFTYQIRSWEVNNAAAPDLRKVDITVWWWGNPEGTPQQDFRTGFGRMNVTLSRLVFTRSKIVVNSQN